MGTLHVQVAPSASEQKTAHMVTQLLREKGFTLLTVQVEKPTFVHCGQRVSFAERNQSITPPQIYVDYGPHAGVIKNV